MDTPGRLDQRHPAARRGAGTGPLVLLVHGFPEFWWSWRHQLTALADAGYRAVACDLRGYGASDKPPRGYDIFTLAADLAGLIRALGERQAIFVGQDCGGFLGWATAVLHPDVVRRLVVVGAPHPLRMRQAIFGELSSQLKASSYLLGFQLPWRPERELVETTRRSSPTSCGGGAARAFPIRRPRPGCGRPCRSRVSRTARWSTTAGSFARCFAPTAGGCCHDMHELVTRPDPANARFAGHLRAAVDGQGIRRVRRRALRLAAASRCRTFPPSRSAAGLQRRTAELAGVSGRDRDAHGRPLNSPPA